MARGLRRALAVGAVVAGCGMLVAPAVAQALRDPTRPPAMRGKSGQGHVVAAEWMLQSVLISPERRYAIINGQVVSPGESVSGAELVAVTEGKVLLRTREGLQTVRLFPDVERRGAEQLANGAAKYRQETPDLQKRSKGQDSGVSGTQK